MFIVTRIKISPPIDGETVETVADYIFLGSKITADGDCSHEIRRCLLLGLSEPLLQAAGPGRGEKPVGDVEKGWTGRGTETGAAKQSRQRMGGC